MNDFIRGIGQKDVDYPDVHLAGIKDCFSSIIDQVGTERLVEAKIPQSESQLYDARLQVLLLDGTKLLINNYANDSAEPIGHGKCYSSITLRPPEAGKEGLSCYVLWEE